MQKAFLIQFQQRAATWEEGLEGASKVIAGPERILSKAGLQRKSFRSLMWETNLPCPEPLSWKGSRGSSYLGDSYLFLGQLQVLLPLQVLLLPCGLVGSASSELGDEKHWEGLYWQSASR